MNQTFVTLAGASLLAVALGVFVRGMVHFPFEDEEDAIEALEAAGFADVRLHPGTEAGDDPGSERVMVIWKPTWTPIRAVAFGTL